MKRAGDVPFEHGLHDLGSGILAYLQPDGSMGWSNAGLVTGEAASLLVDTLFDLRLTRLMLEAMAPLTAVRPIRAALNTHSNPDHTFGNQLLPADAEVWASQATAREFSDYPPTALEELRRNDAGGRRHLDRFDFSGIELRPPDRTFTGATEIEIGGRTIELLEVGPAHTAGDVIVHVPDGPVVFAGDILFVGVAPIMWQGPIENWIAALDRIVELGPELVVPGHGPVTDTDGVRRERQRLEDVAGEARRRFERGMSVTEAVADLGTGPFSGLIEAERIVIVVDRIYATLDPTHAPLGSGEMNAAMGAIEQAG